MTEYKRVYLDYFYPGWGRDDFIACENCGTSAVDIHHIDPRGMGGRPSNDLDVPDNLMALCRKCHTYAENNPSTKESFREKHKIFSQWRLSLNP